MTKLTQEQTKGTKTFYLPKMRTNSRPELTLLVRRVNSVFEFGLAVCNPKDNFCKATGRRIAWNRLTHRANTATTALAVQKLVYNYIIKLARRRPELLERITLEDIRGLSKLDEFFPV